MQFTVFFVGQAPVIKSCHAPPLHVFVPSVFVQFVPLKAQDVPAPAGGVGVWAWAGLQHVLVGTGSARAVSSINHPAQESSCTKVSTQITYDDLILNISHGLPSCGCG